ncbi:MAG: radical SAM protein [Planctomycetia bacterium]|nr:radical SAM protein [Planctomycetia bacterium]
MEKTGRSEIGDLKGSELMESDVADATFFRHHERTFRDFRYVYPVISRRAGGLSIGVNLNPGMECPFRCVYCQVNRSSRTPERPECTSGTVSVDPDFLESELIWLAERVVSGDFWKTPPFDEVSPQYRRWNDFAISGDGEPLLSPWFSEVVRRMVRVREMVESDSTTANAPMMTVDPAPPRPKIVLITSASALHLASARPGLELLRTCENCEMWAKLDAGTEAYYRRVNRSGVPFGRILDNLKREAEFRPIVIQTLLVDGTDRDGVPLRMDESELLAYAGRLREINTSGTIDHVQIHSVAREPAEPSVRPASVEFREYVAGVLHSTTGLRVVVH